MNITADDAKRSCSNSKSMSVMLDRLLKVFQAKILDAGKDGLSSVSVPMPVNFNIPGMSNSTAQTIIYSKLIEELKSRKFNVHIIMERSVVVFHISWIAKKDNAHMQHMREIIAKHTISSKLS